MIGIQRTSPAFATVRIAPRLDGFYGPSRASGRFNSPRGEIYVAWDRSDNNATLAKGVAGKIALQVTLPLGVTTAAVLVPPPYEQASTAAAEVVCATGSQRGAKQVAINSQNSLKAYPKVVHLECSGGGHIRNITLATYSTTVNTSASCELWTPTPATSPCYVPDVSAVVESMCMDRQHCAITLNNETFADPCPHEIKTFAVRATCRGGVLRERAPTFVVTESGQTIWDGSKLIKSPTGIISAHASTNEDEPGLMLELLSGDYFFESHVGSSQV